MVFHLLFTPESESHLRAAERSGDSAKLKKIRRALGRLEQDPKYPSLQSHKYQSMSGANGEEVWDSYVENNTPSAWRIFWHYGPEAGQITVLAITQHP